MNSCKNRYTKFKIHVCLFLQENGSKRATIFNKVLQKFYKSFENYKRDNSVVSYGEPMRKVHEILKIILLHSKCNCRNDKNCLINKKDRTGQQSDYSNVIVLAKQLALS